jgi:GTP 3',8-cyclase
MSANLPSTMPLDQLGRALQTLRISLIDRCNFRCPYCMPEADYPREHAFLSAEQRLSFAEITRLTRVFHALGVRKVRLTGGEPLLRKNTPELIAALKQIPDLSVALTTNASLLAEHAQALRAAGLDQLTISLDSLEPERFQHMSGGRGDLHKVLAGLAAAERAGFRQIKINCVVQRGVNESDVLALLAHFRHSGHILRFIEYMDVGSCNQWRAADVVSTAELLETIARVYPLHALPAQPSDTAQRYALDDGSAELGFIASVSQPFCRGCTRARISADGQLHLCLFSSHGIDLRSLLRDTRINDLQLHERLVAIWQQRADRYSELRASPTEISVPVPKRHASAENRRIEMYQIGG